jgi:hypothetical protein
MTLDGNSSGEKWPQSAENDNSQRSSDINCMNKKQIIISLFLMLLCHPFLSVDGKAEIECISYNRIYSNDSSTIIEIWPSGIAGGAIIKSKDGEWPGKIIIRLRDFYALESFKAWVVQNKQFQFDYTKLTPEQWKQWRADKFLDIEIPEWLIKDAKDEITIQYVQVFVK